MAKAQIDLMAVGGTSVEPMIARITIPNGSSQYIDVKNFTKLTDKEGNSNKHTVYGTTADFTSEVSSANGLASLTYTTISDVTTTETSFDITNYTALKFTATGTGTNIPLFKLS